MLADRDLDILRTLSLHVRLLSLKQVATYWWSDSPSAIPAARRRLGLLVKSGHLERLRFPIHPIPALHAPVFTWRPQLPPPDYGAVSWTLQSRWTEQPSPTTTFIATTQAANLFGGRSRGRLKRSFQASHDLGLAAVYLHFRKTRPEEAALWIGEDILARFRKRQKIPDAVIAAAPENKPQLVIEFGGAYDAERVRSFHIDSKIRKLAYELW
jgi:hypothetical protein